MMKRRWIHRANGLPAIHVLILAMATTIGAGTTWAGKGDPSAAGDSPGDEAPPDRTTRGIGIHATFEHLLQIRHPPAELYHDLHDGEQVMSGDRIHVVIRTSYDAYVYLAFCARHHLTVYPSPRGIRTRAGARLEIPSPGELVIDDEPGTEILYVIVSEDELSDADPRLAQALKAPPAGRIATDCGTYITAAPAPASGTAGGSPNHSNTASKDAGATKSPAPGATKVLRGQPMPRKLPVPAPANQRPQDDGPSPLPDPDYERNARNFVWYPDAIAADSTGIAVVRYTFTHVARRGP